MYTDMMARRRSLSFLLLALGLPLACGDDDGQAPSTPRLADASSDTGTIDDAGADTGSLTGTTKLDLLLVIDNSSFMSNKQDALARSLGSFFDSIAASDIHVGVISTSIATGGDVCDPAIVRVVDERAHLINRASYKIGDVVPGAESGFLSLGPGGSVPDKATLTARTADLIRGVSEGGCGYEAQLEAMYRFVADPAPFDRITKDSAGHAVLTGVDYELLAQRRAFFRSDSEVGILLLTDEDDTSIDGRSLRGFGYGFTSLAFPRSLVQSDGGSTTPTSAPRGTSACAKSPSSAECTSCFEALLCDPDDAACQKVRADVACKTSGATGKSGAGYDGFLPRSEDNLNIRGYRMKERFGVDAHFPLSRYVAALQGKRLPDGKTEHPLRAGASGDLDEYIQVETCSNPLFSLGLPNAAGDELCNLAPNGRDPRTVHFALIVGGVPSLLGSNPDWPRLLGADPSALDFTGADPHMIPSTRARPPLSGEGLPLGDNGTDPVTGREWNTLDGDLEYACSFALTTPRDCSTPGGVACQCYAGVPSNPPLCGGNGNTTQLRASASPGVRELQLAKELGDQASVASICGEGTAPYNSFLLDFARKLSAPTP